MLSLRRTAVQTAPPLLRALYSTKPPLESAEPQAPTPTPELSHERYPLPAIQSPVFKKSLAAAQSQTKTLNAVVVSSGFMAKTVKVRVGKQKWNAFIGKNFNKSHHLLVHDPASSLRTGDIISVSPNWRASKTVNHVVKEILAPFEVPIDQRPPVPTLEERVAMRHKRNWERKTRKNPQVARRWESYKRWKGVQRATADGRDRGGNIERVAESMKNLNVS